MYSNFVGTAKNNNNICCISFLLWKHAYGDGSGFSSAKIIFSFHSSGANFLFLVLASHLLCFCTCFMVWEAYFMNDTLPTHTYTLIKVTILHTYKRKRNLRCLLLCTLKILKCRKKCFNERPQTMKKLSLTETFLIRKFIDLKQHIKKCLRTWLSNKAKGKELHKISFQIAPEIRDWVNWRTIKKRNVHNFDSGTMQLLGNYLMFY